MAERLIALSTAKYKYLPSWVRRRFEAATGIDCRAMFDPKVKGRWRPLQAAAIAERFLASPEAERYEDGVRYFFGHRIP
ncbi:hypothetical protein G6O69_21455 [Pseudenhygromyxa sp. WMMC2535]|uniref:hypothetical protein n=1 Tax=Pseudenhygromyxa sp. WMMC2535 TaxID=2712867 RepID=UPI001594F8E7|nr:hypothetical protein [Pseudenhygromyxa sp. WMMC2535]NVB40421.1 hypothetical protein [Pseudenhygromyxa sp. WMMC2535]